MVKVAVFHCLIVLSSLTEHFLLRLWMYQNQWMSAGTFCWVWGFSKHTSHGRNPRLKERKNVSSKVDPNTYYVFCTHWNRIGYKKGIWILFLWSGILFKGCFGQMGPGKSFLLQRGRSIIRPTFSQKQLTDELSRKLVLQSVFCPSLDIDILYVFICLHPDWLT